MPIQMRGGGLDWSPEDEVGDTQQDSLPAEPPFDWRGYWRRNWFAWAVVLGCAVLAVCLALHCSWLDALEALRTDGFRTTR